MRKICIIISVFFILFGETACANEASEATEILNNTDFSEIEMFLQGEEQDISFPELMRMFINGEKINVKDVFSKICDMLWGEVGACIAFAIRIVAVGIIFSFIKALKASSFSSAVEEAANFVCYTIIAFILCNVFINAVDCAKVVFERLNEFISICTPLLVTFLAGCGAAKTAACVSPVFLIGIEIISILTTNFFIPLIFSLTMLSVFSKISKNIDISAYARVVKSVLKWSMGLVFTIFSGIVSISGGFSSATDALSLRAAKYVVNSAIPVSGQMISDTMGTFVYSCSIVKNAFGAAAICIVVVICAFPVIKLFSIMLVVNISSAIISPFADKAVSETVSEIAGAISYILGLVCLIAVLFIISIAVIVQFSNGVVI